MINRLLRTLIRDPRLHRLKVKVISFLKARLGSYFYIIKQWALQKLNAYFVCCPQVVDKKYKGYLTYGDNQAIKGWVTDSLGNPLNKLTVKVDGRNTEMFFKRAFRKDVENIYGVSNASGFEITFSRTNYLPNTYQIEVFDEDTGRLVFDSKIEFRTGELNVFEDHKEVHNIQNTVDIIIPVYADLRITQNCILSVLGAKIKKRYRILIVNDCSPEPELTSWLREIANQNESIILLENEQNIGFVGSVNRGMKFGKSNHVVLLNSDTVVSDHWLDKMLYPTIEEQNVASVTPMSNNATIFSFPSMNPSKDIPLADSLTNLNSALEKYNLNKYLEVPTGHGFCMLITREALNEFGYFDELKWGKGYGEENDFCLKAQSSGWKNLVVCDTFVQHVGSVSFGSSASERINKNLVLLDKLYPSYLATVSSFVVSDPLKKFRRQPALDLLFNHFTKNQSILHVIHSLGGGTEYAMTSLIALTVKEDTDCFVLRSVNNGRVLRLENSSGNLTADFDAVTEFTDCIETLKQLKISLIHYHQLLDFSTDIFNLPYLLDCPYDIALHDYYLSCLRVNLLTEKAQYCGGAELEKCFNCLNVCGPHPSSHDVVENKNELNKVLSRNEAFAVKARRLVAPSDYVKDYFETIFNLSNVVVKKHPEKTKRIELIKPSKANKTIKVAVIGAIGIHKGLERFKSLLNIVDSGELDLEFVLFGYSSADIDKYACLTVTGKYNINDLPELIKESSCDRALFLSPWPETFSYTLSEAFELGLYSFAPDLGAFSDRIPEVGVGELFDINISNDALLDLLTKNIPEHITYTAGEEYLNIYRDYYDF